MANANTIKITLNGVHYNIATTESEDYVKRLAGELDEQVRSVIEKNPSLSFNDVMVLCCMSYVDAYKRSEENADRMRSQVSEYLEDAAKVRISLDDSKKESASMKKERDEARRENGNLKKQLEQLKQELAVLKGIGVEGAKPPRSSKAAVKAAEPEKADKPAAPLKDNKAEAEKTGPVEKVVDNCLVINHRESTDES